jgi:hypothetical protein
MRRPATAAAGPDALDAINEQLLDRLVGRAARTANGGADHVSGVSCCLSAAGIGFLDHPVPLEIAAFLTVGLPARHLSIAPDTSRVGSGQGAVPVFRPAHPACPLLSTGAPQAPADHMRLHTESV